MNYKKIILGMLLIVVSSIACKTKSKNLNQGDVETIRKLDSLISILKSDIHMHEIFESGSTEEDIKATETKLGVQLPRSYKYFLKKFGNGANWLYHIDQPINGINKKHGNIHWLGKFRNYLGNTIQSDGFGTFKTNTLLCLMTDSSNGGAWCWITTESNENGEWPLAYFNIADRKLYYRTSNFSEWLSIATKCKGEVIRALDIEYKLGLG